MNVGYRNLAAATAILFTLAGAALAQTGEPKGKSAIAGAWQLTRVAGKDAVPGVMATIEIGEDGKLTGDTGCNRFVGTISVEGDTVQVSRVVSTRRLCLDPVQTQEDTLLRSLETITRADVDEAGRLVMRNDRDIVLEAAALAEPPK